MRWSIPVALLIALTSVSCTVDPLLVRRIDGTIEDFDTHQPISHAIVSHRLVDDKSDIPQLVHDSEDQGPIPHEIPARRR